MSLIKRSEPRNIKITPNTNPYAAGSVIAEFGNTKVHITASIEESVPGWMKGKGSGWVTGEYSMLPSSTHTRSRRERSKVSGRTQEIQRLIGRSLRSIINLNELGERSIIVDCDVLVADGGTRTTSISGAYVALSLAIKKLMKEGKLKTNPITEQLGAISVGVDKEGMVIADLNYEEDSSCDTDMNIVMTRKGHFVELQGTAEGTPFTRDQLNALVDVAESSLEHVFAQQDQILND
ncbi:ribonuclease PH [Bacteriovoracaceae bacterium]|nr:ribonuclease PH [Bacteriovoracaceae bacterium]